MNESLTNVKERPSIKSGPALKNRRISVGNKKNYEKNSNSLYRVICIVRSL